MEWMKHKGCLTQMGGKMFHVPKGIVTDGGFSLCPSSKHTSIQSCDFRGFSWLMTLGIQIVTETVTALKCLATYLLLSWELQSSTFATKGA